MKALVVVALLVGLFAVAILTFKYLIVALGFGLIFIVLLSLLASATR